MKILGKIEKISYELSYTGMFDKKCLGVITAKNLKENMGRLEGWMTE